MLLQGETVSSTFYILIFFSPMADREQSILLLILNSEFLFSQAGGKSKLEPSLLC